MTRLRSFWRWFWCPLIHGHVWAKPLSNSDFARCLKCRKEKYIGNGERDWS